MLSGNGDADVASYSCTFLGGEWDARLLLLDAAVLLGVVRALLTVNAVFAGHILTLGQRLLMADFLGYLVADGFRDIDTNGSDDRLNGSDDRSNRRDGRKEETFGLLGFLLSQLLGLLGSELFVQAPSPPLGLGDNLVTAFLDCGSLAGLLEVGYADILFYGMASLFEDGRTDWYVAALLLPNDVTKGNGMPGTLLLHDKRTGVFVLGMAFAGWKCGTSWLGLEVTGVVVLGETLLLPDFVENGVTNRSGANGDRLGNSKVGTNGKGRTSDETTFVFAGLDRSLEGTLSRLDTFLLDRLRGLEGFPVFRSDGSRDQTSEYECGELHDVRCSRIRNELPPRTLR